MTRKEAERQESVTFLREWLRPGDTVHTKLIHVSRSGMSRVIEPVKLWVDDKGESQVAYLGYHVARALGWGAAKDQGVKVSGCGMDMGFHLVNSLSYAVYPEYACLGAPRVCPSSFHQGKDYDKVPTEPHKDGYALRQRWL